MSDVAVVSSSSSPPIKKLTKKQQKSANFKAGVKKDSNNAAKGKGKGKDRGKGKLQRGEGLDVPEEDLLDDEGGVAGNAISTKPIEKAKKMENKKNKEDAPDAEVAAPKKRKRSEEATTSAKAAAAGGSQSTIEAVSKSNGKSKAIKTAFDDEGKATEVVQAADPGGKGKNKATDGSGGGGESGRKFIVFVGNMSFKSTAAEITSHFASHCGESPSVRLLTTKSDQSKLSKSRQKSIAKGKAADTTVQSRGCAFVEFKSASALQKALGLHHTLFGGRQINVELSAGGGGKSETRLAKIKEKNSKLDEERKKLHEKYIAPSDEAKKKETEEKRAKGEDVGPPKKKARKGEDGEAQWGPRGGATANASDQTQGAGAPKRSKMPRWMATGANAVRMQG